jgi:hypothetical protein
MGRRSAEDQTSPKHCPDCGTVLFNLGSHRGKRYCLSVVETNKMKALGYARFEGCESSYLECPKVFRRFLREAATDYAAKASRTYSEDWLPKWVLALLKAGHWTEEGIKIVEGDKDLQTALALEYDIVTRGPT